jgi:nicotinate-nucleotide adenylyltransferase
MKVAIFSGSFNPVHRGHVALAEYVLRRQLAEEVWWIRSPQNPWKAQAELMDDALRTRLLARALEGRPGMRLCDIEDRLPRPSYTIDTLHALSREYPEHEFALMIGGDNWAAFRKWRAWEEILAEFRLLVYPRPGYELRPEATPHVTFLADAPQYDISATELRAALREGRREVLRRWLPDGVTELLLSETQNEPTIPNEGNK